jgi:hypothetical protein
MTTDPRNAEHANASFFFTPSVTNVIEFCRASNFWDAPTAELDMFSRWIRLSDRALAANQKTNQETSKKLGGRGRRKCPSLFCPKPSLS